ncbi:MAG: LUD domain-containing protein [Caldilineaceae bacterium]
MSTRDDILTRLRGTLRRADLPFPPANPRPLTTAERMTVTRAEGDGLALAARFGTELEKLHGTYEVVETMAEARMALMSRLLAWAAEAEAGRRGPRPATGQERTVLGWAPDRLPVTGVADALADMEFGFIAPGSVLTAEERERVRHIRYGVTGVTAAFASTGSMMMVAGPGSNRSASLLPIRHIAHPHQPPLPDHGSVAGRVARGRSPGGHAAPVGQLVHDHRPQQVGRHRRRTHPGRPRAEVRPRDSL